MNTSSGGSPPKSAALHKQSGTYRKDRHGRLADQTRQEPIGSAPEWLDPDEKRQFNALVKRKAPGFLSKDDTESLALLAHLHVKLARHELKVSDVTPFRLLSREFGNTPDSRYRVPGPPIEAKADPFDELMNR